MADDLRDILELARRACPEVPDHAWSKIERTIRINYGASRAYIAAQPKKSKLEKFAELDGHYTTQEIANLMGIDPSYVKVLRYLSRRNK